MVVDLNLLLIYTWGANFYINLIAIIESQNHITYISELHEKKCFFFILWGIGSLIPIFKNLSAQNVLHESVHED